jgi:hypothetical protein
MRRRIINTISVTAFTEQNVTANQRREAGQAIRRKFRNFLYISGTGSAIHNEFIPLVLDYLRRKGYRLVKSHEPHVDDIDAHQIRKYIETPSTPDAVPRTLKERKIDLRLLESRLGENRDFIITPTQLRDDYYLPNDILIALSQKNKVTAGRTYEGRNNFGYPTRVVVDVLKDLIAKIEGA